MIRRRERWSQGGDAVLRSLIAGGMTLPTGRDVHLRETRVPSIHAPRALLAQNALAVAPRRDVRAMILPVNRITWAKVQAMRYTAGVNLRRARNVVVLSNTMSHLVAAAVPDIGDRLRTCPVTLPLDVVDHVRALNTARDNRRQREPDAVVIASSTAHKDIETVVRAFALVAPGLGLRTVTVFGSRDDEHLARRILELAARLRLTLRLTATDRATLLAAAARAAVVVVPSRLESLGLALPEACVVTSAVAATAIPAHQEVAKRLGATVEWYAPGDVDAATSAITRAASTTADPVEVSASDLTREWRAVVDALDGPSG